MKKTPKLLLLVLGSMLLASAFTACNSDDKKVTTTDSVTTPRMDSMPVIKDTTKMDTAHTRPTPTGH